MKKQMRVILSPNPYRDKHFQTLREAMEVLKNAGIETRVCLPIEVDRSYDLPKDLPLESFKNSFLRRLNSALFSEEKKMYFSF